MTDKVSQFRSGNICRIYLNNFMTFDEIEILPKPHLNVVIGPNGTGKSSILCGICIGLAGKPKDTGRGTTITQYVKNGKDRATIEIEVYNDRDGQGNVIIRREFGKDSTSSKWFLQRKQVKEDLIKRKVEEMGMRVDNLCQFLPQHRVVEFANLNKIELLSKTEEAVGKDELYQQHELLKNSGTSVKNLKSKLTELKNQLTNEKNKNDSLQDQVNNLKRKESFNDSIKQLTQLIMFSNYNSTRKELESVKPKIIELKKEWNAIDTRIEPSTKKLEEIKQSLKSHTLEINKCNGQAAPFLREGQKLKQQWTKAEESISIAKEEFETDEKTNRKIEKEISDLRKQIDILEGQLAESEDLDKSQIKEEINELTNSINVRSQTLVNTQSRCRNYCDEKNGALQDMARWQSKLKSLEDSKARRLQILQQRKYRHIYEACNWLKNNRQLFSGPIHDPLFTTIDFKHQSCTNYLENVVSNKDLIAFVCEDKNDVKLLKRQADANRWMINILHSAPVDPSQYQPQYPIEHIRHLGFHSYIGEMIIGPPAIISYLCRNYRIHNIPVAEEANFDDCPEWLTMFFIGNRRIDKRKSRYDGQWSTNISYNRDPVFFKDFIDPKVKEQIVTEVRDIQQRLEKLEYEIVLLTAQEKEVDKELEELRTQKKNLQMKLVNRQQLINSKNEKQGRVSRCEERKKDLDTSKRNMEAKIKSLVQKMVEIVESHLLLENQVTNLRLKLLRKTFAITELFARKGSLMKDMEADRLMMIQIKEQISQLEIERERHINSGRDWLKKLSQAMGVDLNERNTKTEEARRKLAKDLQNRTLEDLETQLAEKEALRNCITTSGESVLLEFNKRARKIEELQRMEQDMINQIGDENKSVETCRRTWLPEISSLVQTINGHFSKFMSNLDCAGEVSLDKGDDENDFSQYGLSICVKFRDSEKLKELGTYQQSGGERSVSIALFLLSLQTLTSVPFRCVDEINQGMDPTNERKMFTMLVDSTTTENASQYFLVTPKLLPNLPYNRFVSFLIITNWCPTSSSSSRQLSSIPKIISRYKKRASQQRLSGHNA